jgi:death-on-curing protein
VRLRWVDRGVVLAIHAAQLAEHGGRPGLRDSNALASALDRAPNRHAYGCDDIVELAACYAYGLGRNHPFIDGNKRVSAVVTELFLTLNGHTLAATDTEVVATWLAIAAGDIDEGTLTEWLRSRSPASV